MWHSVLSTGAPSLHITCGFFGITLHRIARSLLQNDASIVGVSDAVSPEYMTDEQIAQFESETREKIMAVLSNGFLKQYWADEKSNMEPLPAQSPFNAPLPDADASGWPSDILVRSRMPSRPELAGDVSDWSFVVNDKEYQLPSDMLEVFRCLTDGGTIAVRSLHTIAERSRVDADRVDALLRILSEHGLIEFVTKRT